jgi:Fe2+ transport system protein FeoA
MIMIIKIRKIKGLKLMKTLNNLKKNETGIIESINANEELKYRFMSFGITKNNIIKVIEVTHSKKISKLKLMEQQSL